MANIPRVELRDSWCHSRSFGTVGERSLPSDNVLVRLTIQKPHERPPEHPAIRQWFTEHILLAGALNELHQEELFAEDPFWGPGSIQKHGFQSGQQSSAKLLVACAALRALRCGNLDAARRSCNSWEPVARCFDADFVRCTAFRALRSIVASLTRDNTRAHEDDLLGIEANQAENYMALTKCAASKRSWAARKPKPTLHAVTDVTGRPLHNPDEAGRILWRLGGNLSGS